MQIILPFLNPLQLVEMDYVPDARYNTKHHEDFLFEETIPYWQQSVRWPHPWQTSDNISMQLRSAVGPVKVTMFDQWGSPKAQFNMTPKQYDFFNPSVRIYEMNMPLSGVVPGYYQFVFEFGSLAACVSNVIHVQEKHLNTVYFEYSHRREAEDIYFETGFSSSLRVFGSLVLDKSSASTVIFDDQQLDRTLVASKTYCTTKLYCGWSEGMPDFMVPKINKVLSMSNLMIEGRLYTRAEEGADLEPVNEPDYPMRGWSILLRDKLNRASKLIDADGNSITGAMTVVINVQNRGFVSNQGTGFLTVSDIE